MVQNVHVEIGHGEDDAIPNGAAEAFRWNRFGTCHPTVVVVDHPEVLDAVLLQSTQQRVRITETAIH
ncbi:MAG: hypothetical protein C4346_12545 [Chloroflexota bacterium]